MARQTNGRSACPRSSSDAPVVARTIDTAHHHLPAALFHYVSGFMPLGEVFHTVLVLSVCGQHHTTSRPMLPPPPEWEPPPPKGERDPRTPKSPRSTAAGGFAGGSPAASLCGASRALDDASSGFEGASPAFAALGGGGPPRARTAFMMLEPRSLFERLSCCCAALGSTHAPELTVHWSRGHFSRTFCSFRQKWPCRRVAAR